MWMPSQNTSYWQLQYKKYQNQPSKTSINWTLSDNVRCSVFFLCLSLSLSLSPTFIHFHSCPPSHSISFSSTHTIHHSSPTISTHILTPSVCFSLSLPSLSGFQVVSYPLMERAFESSRGPAAPPMLELAVVGAKSGSVAEAESSLLEGEWESGSRSDSPAHGGGGTATPSYLDGEGR